MSKEPLSFTDIINEGSTAIFTATLKDESGTAITSGDIDSATLTLFDVASGSIVNSRNAQNVLNTNNVTINGSGVLTFNLQTEDTAILDQTLEFETHRAEFVITYNSSASKSVFDVDFNIRNLTKQT